MQVQLGKGKAGKRTKEWVRIEPSDVWNLDHTLALIIWSALVEYKKQAQGVVMVDDKDLPEHLHYIFPTDPADYTPKQEQMLISRYDYVLTEIIWAMKEIANEYQNKPKIRSRSKKYKAQDAKDALKYEKKISNGCELFGKYFRGFWD